MFRAQPLDRKLLILKVRRDVRVVEGARLESVCRGNSTEGSNPSLSANYHFHDSSCCLGIPEIPLNLWVFRAQGVSHSFVVVHRSVGTLRYWRYHYRFEGRQKTLAIGVFPDVSLQVARGRHLFARRMLANGIDLSTLKRTLGKHAFALAAREWIIHSRLKIVQKFA